MATSAALTNSDILSVIFEHFDSNDPRGVNDSIPPAWARAARVCVAFHEPAIRLLWRSLDSVVPLLNLLPSSFTRVREVATGEGEKMTYDIYVSILVPYSCFHNDRPLDHLLHTRADIEVR